MIVVKCDVCQEIIKEDHANKRYKSNGRSIDVCNDCLPIYSKVINELNEYREKLEEEFNQKFKDKEAELLEIFQK